MVFHFDITDVQYNSQEAEIPTTPKQPSTTETKFCGAIQNDAKLRF